MSGSIPGIGRSKASLCAVPSGVRSAFMALLLIWPGMALAQGSGAVLAGEVIDSSGAVVPGAQVTVQDTSNGRSQTVSTAADGRFRLEEQSPGQYRISVQGRNFAPAETEVRVLGGESRFVTITLSMPTVSQHIEVSSAAEPYVAEEISSATKADTRLRDIPQSITVVNRGLIVDQAMDSMEDVVRYMPGVTMGQGEGHRDQPTIRGNNTTADFFIDGVRDDAQYYRDLYNVERVEALKGPNAMIFGRGGGGGVLNRVSKEAGWSPLRELILRGGSYDNRRITTDFGQDLNDALAVRFNGMYEDSGSFRNYFNVKRYGLNPVVNIRASERSDLKIGYEHFKDRRVVDRGIPSYGGLPADSEISTFFGDPDDSRAKARVDALRATFRHEAGSGVVIRNHTSFADYDKFYQNVFPGSVSADKNLVSISGYNNGTLRRNLFNQTDLTYAVSTGFLRHKLSAGTEFGRQSTSNLRNTAYFDGGSTSFLAPFSNPTIDVPVFFRQSTTDADNHVTNYVAAAFLQDQVDFSRYFQVIGGIRYDYFDLDFLNHRNGQPLGRSDNLMSPRFGMVFKPATPVSLYASYSVSYLPSSGDQFSSMNANLQALRPEKFSNYELGAKWEFARNLNLSAALYELDRTNTTAPDPNQPGRLVQTGRQRTRGFELSLNGSATRNWQIATGYAYQNAEITRDTAAAARGARIPIVPSHSVSLWNKYRVHNRVSLGMGIIHQGDRYAAIDNKVVLPGYTRADSAVFLTLSENLGAQVNVENVLNRRYYATAHSNNNISPGSPRIVSVLLRMRF